MHDNGMDTVYGLRVSLRRVLGAGQVPDIDAQPNDAPKVAAQ